MSDTRRPPTQSDRVRLPLPVPRRYTLVLRPWVARSIAGHALVVVTLVVTASAMLSYAFVLGGALAVDRTGDHPWWTYLVGVVVFGVFTVFYAGATADLWRANFKTGRGRIRDQARPG